MIRSLTSVAIVLALQYSIGCIYQEMNAFWKKHFDCTVLYKLLFPWGCILFIHCIALIVQASFLPPIVCDLTVLTYDAYQQNSPSWKRKLLLAFVVCFLFYSSLKFKILGRTRI